MGAVVGVRSLRIWDYSVLPRINCELAQERAWERGLRGYELSMRLPGDAYMGEKKLETVGELHLNIYRDVFWKWVQLI